MPPHRLLLSAATVTVLLIAVVTVTVTTVSRRRTNTRDRAQAEQTSLTQDVTTNTLASKNSNKEDSWPRPEPTTATVGDGIAAHRLTGSPSLRPAVNASRTPITQSPISSPTKAAADTVVQPFREGEGEGEGEGGGGGGGGKDPSIIDEGSGGGGGGGKDPNIIDEESGKVQEEKDPSITEEEPTSVVIDDNPFVFSGKLVDHPEVGLKVASGLKVRVLAQSGKRVLYTSKSATQPTSKKCRFHVRPDGAAAFDAGTNNGDWYCCSNSEVKEFQKSASNRCNGGLLGGKCRAGVYCLLIDRDGEVKDYQHRLGGDDTCGFNDGIGPDLPSTSTNCQGGVTPWQSYVSCEETGPGYCWQVDPTGKRMPQRIEALGMSKPGQIDGDGWEAMAVDTKSDPSCPNFFFSEDRSTGKVRRLRPDCDDQGAVYPGWDMLHKGNIKVDYLEFIGGCNGGNRTSGKFRWTDNIEDAERSAEECYPYTEGIAVAYTTGTPILYFVTKKSDLLFSLEHETANEGRWEADATNTNKLLSGEGNFQRYPDQLTMEGDFMFHTTDGSETPGIYVHNLQSAEYYTLWQSFDVGQGEEESVGHALSPDKRFIVGALQKDGRIFLLSREDGKAFRGLDFALRRR